MPVIFVVVHDIQTVTPFSFIVSLYQFKALLFASAGCKRGRNGLKLCIRATCMLRCGFTVTKEPRVGSAFFSICAYTVLTISNCTVRRRARRSPRAHLQITVAKQPRIGSACQGWNPSAQAASWVGLRAILILTRWRLAARLLDM